LGVVALARTSDVLPGRTSQKTGITHNYNGGDEHQRDAQEPEQYGLGEAQNQDHQPGEKPDDSPTHAASAVGVNIRFSNAFGKTGILLGEGIFKLGQDSLLVI